MQKYSPLNLEQDSLFNTEFSTPFQSFPSRRLGSGGEVVVVVGGEGGCAHMFGNEYRVQGIVRVSMVKVWSNVQCVGVLV